MEDVDWDSAKTIQAYEAYLLNYPAGRYAKEGKKRIEDMVWADIEKVGKMADYESYLDKYAQGRYAEEARERIEKLFWRQTVTEDTVTVYERYIKKYPGSKFIKQANEYIKLARTYQKASKNVKRLKMFLKNNPKTRFSQKASRDIEKLMIAQIEAKGIGGRFVVKSIMPQNKGHKGGITIMSQVGNDGYMISPNYYNDEMVFSMGAFNVGNSMESSQPLNPGSVWRFVGKDIALGDCVFSGEGKIESPLTFILIENVGFVHIRSNGSVKCTDGTREKLRDN